LSQIDVTLGFTVTLHMCAHTHTHKHTHTLLTNHHYDFISTLSSAQIARGMISGVTYVKRAGRTEK